MADTKFKTGDHVIYASNGVCRIADVRKESFAGAPKTYYVMNALADPRSVIYVPTDSESLTAAMHRLLTKPEIEKLLDESSTANAVWISDTKARAQYFTEILTRGERAELLMIIRQLTAYKTELEGQKKKFYVSDERVLSAAEKLISEEFAFVLGMEPKDVIPYILEKVK